MEGGDQTYLVHCRFLFCAPLIHVVPAHATSHAYGLFVLCLACPAYTLKTRALPLVVIPREDGREQREHLEPLRIGPRSEQEREEDIGDEAPERVSSATTAHLPIDIIVRRVFTQPPQCFGEMFVVHHSCTMSALLTATRPTIMP
jgi:hypothetical protein